MRPFLQFLAALALMMSMLFVIGGCGRRGEPPMLTGRVLTAAQIRAAFPAAFCADPTYAEINSAWLAAHQAEFESAMSNLGNPMRYEVRAASNRYSAKWAADAQAVYYVREFHSANPATALAIGEVWGATPAGEHALIAAFTERGLIYWEPQLTDRHEQSPPLAIHFARF